MKTRSILKKVLAAVLCATMLTCAAGLPASAEGEGSDFANKIEDRFADPSMTERPGARWWLAEGSHTDQTIRESIKELYDYGFGSLEFVTLDESAYLDDATYAWGSEEWIHDSHLIMEECNRYGMGVSFTSGTHWSTANLTVITPDEETASQELSYMVQPVSAGETFEGELLLPELPENVSQLKFVRIIAAKVSAQDDSALIEESLTDVSALVTEHKDGTWSIQYTAPSDGDYLLFSFWQHGTGESYKPAATGKAYTINYYDQAGVQALTEYWDRNVLTDDMKQLILENGHVSMFMDSLEVRTKGTNSTKNLWSKDFLDEFENRCGYDVTRYLPLLIISSNPVMGEKPDYPYSLESQEKLCDKIRTDLLQVNTELYIDNCLRPLSDYLHENGITLRAQNSYGKLLEISQPIKYLDFVETESFEFAAEVDSFRNMSGAAHLYEIPFSSETGATFWGNYKYNNNYFRQIFYTQFAAGIQKTVTHGYASEFGPEGNVKWPGYEGMQPIFSERFNKRQPNSIDYTELMQHVARLQKILQQGIPQMDLGILRTDYELNCSKVMLNHETNNLRSHKAEYWQDMTLQDAGYTYDYFSPYLLQDQDITCENGLVQADGVGYQALIVYQEEMPYESAEMLYQWAKDGLPVVLIAGPTEEKVGRLSSGGDWIKKHAGAALSTGRNDGKDADLAEVMAKIKALDTVKTVRTQAEAYDALIELGVHPRAEFVQKNQNLLTVMRKADDANYLYVYNYMYKDEENYVGQISVDGIYQPYAYDTWSNKAEELGSYAYDDSRTVLNVDIAPGEVQVFALDPNDQAAKTVVSSHNVNKVSVQDGEFILQAPQSGKTSVTYSDGSVYETDVTVPDDIVLDKWNLTVESYEPGDKIVRTEDRGTGHVSTEVTYDTKKVQIEVGETALIPWKDLEKVGPTVSGVGTYKNTFSLPDDWSKDNGLVFKADSFGGGTAALFVNGQKAAVNMDNGCADITEYVKPGNNTIEVRVTSSLRNKMLEIGYAGWGAGIPQPDDYGMIGTVTLDTYTKAAAVEKKDPSSSEESSSKPDDSPSNPDSSHPSSEGQPNTGANDSIVFVMAALMLAAGAAAVLCRRKAVK
ncbi:MAG: LPXTG cell wall anchor domain-containing protein [Clostridiales bacterium]|nr:LPXTG cell wall anchor domain-containing protein [Clostridiales bacterium]